MKVFRTILIVASLAFGLLSCKRTAPETVIEGEFEVTPVSGNVVIKGYDGESYIELGSVELDNNSFSFSFVQESGTPDFVYLMRGGKRLALLLLAPGDHVKVLCDTCGNWSVSGSEDCARIRENEMALASLAAQETVTGRQFVEFYRKMMKYVIENRSSLTVLPVLYSKIGDVPVFSQPIDAVVFNEVADSLDAAYPGVKYVSTLRKEAAKRSEALALHTMLAHAESRSYPDMEFPDRNAVKVSLGSVVKDAKATLVVFWDASEVGHRLFNQDVLLPLYKKYSPSGLRIYDVNVSSAKTAWAAAVLNQNLPWVNVCDAEGRSVALYGLEKLPEIFLINNDKVEKLTATDLDFITKKVAAALR